MSEFGSYLGTMTAGAATLLVLLAGGAAEALTEADVDAAAAKAHRGIRTVVRRLAATNLAGRDNDTPGSVTAQTWLVRKLKRLGQGAIVGVAGDTAYRQPFESSGQRGTNLLAVIRGRELPDEYVVVGAHYDHLDSRSDANGHCAARATPGSAVCNGATDNATGVAAVLAAGKAVRKLPTPPRRSIVLALWDAEEDGLVGSQHYVANPPVPLAAITAYVNFDIQGAVLLPSLRDTSFAVGAETGGGILETIVDDAVNAEGIDTLRLSYIFGQYRSDYVSFGEAGVPTVFFSDSTGGCYHTVLDDPSVVSYPKLIRQSHVGFRTAIALAETSTPPVFSPASATLAEYDDAVAIAATVRRGMADVALLPPGDHAALEQADATLQALVAAGSAAFDAADAATLLRITVQLVELLTRIPCQRF